MALDKLDAIERITSEIGQLDARIEQARQLNDSQEAGLFGAKPLEDDARKAAMMGIALRDELIEELLTRRAMLIQALAS